MSSAIEQETSLRVRLPAMLDLRAAMPLTDVLRSARGRELTIEAQDVRRLGGLGVQVLLSAALTWARDGVMMRIEAPSSAFREAVQLFAAASLEGSFTNGALDDDGADSR